MGNTSDSWLAMKLEGEDGFPGFAFISNGHPDPTLGVRALIEASGSRPRKVGKSKWLEADEPPPPIVKHDSGTTFANVVSRLQREGPA